MIVEATTDLSQFVGKRVVVNGVRTTRVNTFHHGAEATKCAAELAGGVWGDCVDDGHGDCRGGASAFWWPYGTDLELAA